ncbi:MAG: ABC transporter permease [Propionibacterium sp.]|nr:ABC transporter permease [Propionibacterium sp.]
MTSPIVPAVLRAAAVQAGVTLKRKANAITIVNIVLWPAIFLIVLRFFRDTRFLELAPAGSYLLGGFLAFGIVVASVLGVSAEIQTEREDGTLLRAKAIPHGMTGHLIAKLMSSPVDLLAPMVVLLIGVPFVAPDVLPTEPWRWGLLAVTFVLAGAAMLPWGAVLGSIFRTMMGLGFAMMGVYAVAAVAGIFYPLHVLPGWLQVIGQATPLYWIGLLTRRALLPGEAAAIEVGGVWRTEIAVLVLLTWAVVGLALASVLLRRMARRQSGSTVAAARERVLSRGY